MQKVYNLRYVQLWNINIFLFFFFFFFSCQGEKNTLFSKSLRYKFGERILFIEQGTQEFIIGPILIFLQYVIKVMDIFLCCQVVYSGTFYVIKNRCLRKLCTTFSFYRILFGFLDLLLNFVSKQQIGERSVRKQIVRKQIDCLRQTQNLCKLDILLDQIVFMLKKIKFKSLGVVDRHVRQLELLYICGVLVRLFLIN
eukprot:TRINITY_DN18893_c0_g1_i31.p2 TRINITY_DN18893_c0_g1~~TRINITY_DN18893_c0_g1_i31.p2  ORF type:complete len:197 (-),score=-4.52 TRINITY_DN18893_c0_g1_i31:1437-2027(-)